MVLVDYYRCEYLAAMNSWKESAMRRLFRLMAGTLLLSCFFLLLFTPAPAQESATKAETPVLVTSCGQSPGPVRIQFFLKRLQTDHVYDLQVTAADVVAAKESGTPFKSLIIVTGASLKGMGAAGVSIQDELDRIGALIEEAKNQGIKIIGAHIEGMSRRAQGAAPGDNSDELSIDAVCPKSDLLVILKEGNEDDRFTAISNSYNIPIIIFEKNMELGDVLKELFE